MTAFAIFVSIITFFVYRLKNGRKKEVEVSNPNPPQYVPLGSTIPVHQSVKERVEPIIDIDFVAIDFETANRHRSSACAIGMCKVQKGVVVDRYVKYLRPEPFEFESQNVYVHGIDADMTQYAPTRVEDWGNIQAFVGNLPLVAHNA